MDSQSFAELAQKISEFLLPFLPYLLKAGEKSAEEAGKKLGGEAWERAKSLWEKLRRRDKVTQVAQTASAVPDNPALRDALREEITRALAEDAALRGEMTRIVSELKVRAVRKSGKVVGVSITTSKGSITIESKVHTNDVSGEVTGVKYDE